MEKIVNLSGGYSEKHQCEVKRYAVITMCNTFSKFNIDQRVKEISKTMTEEEMGNYLLTGNKDLIIPTVRSIEIMQSAYDEKSVFLSRSDIKSINEAIEEGCKELKKEKITLNDYWS